MVVRSPKVRKLVGLWVFSLKVGSASAVYCYKADVVPNQSQQLNGALRPGIAAYKQFLCSTYIELQCLPS